MRIILFTGKGGVGKTTVAAATALAAAGQGLKTLVISTDPAHSLADALNCSLSPEPTAVAPNLFAQELDVYYSMKKHWSHVRDLMQVILRWQGINNVAAEEMSALPGMEEASAFLWLEDYYQQKKYDLIIIDSAPTGETLSLLSLPQVTQSWVMKAFPGQSVAVKGLGALVRNMTGIPLDKGMAELENLFTKLESIQRVHPDCPQPGKNGHQRSQTSLYIPPALRLPCGCHHREPHLSGRGRHRHFRGIYPGSGKIPARNI